MIIENGGYFKKNMTKNNNINIELTDENYMVKDENGEMVPNYELTMVNFNDGDVVKGRVVKIEKDEVLVDIGFKSEGVIPVNELPIRNNVKPEEILKIDDVLEIPVIEQVRIYSEFDTHFLKSLLFLMIDSIHFDNVIECWAQPIVS